MSTAFSIIHWALSVSYKPPWISGVLTVMECPQQFGRSTAISGSLSRLDSSPDERRSALKCHTSSVAWISGADTWLNDKTHSIGVGKRTMAWFVCWIQENLYVRPIKCNHDELNDHWNKCDSSKNNVCPEDVWAPIRDIKSRANARL